MSVEALLSMLSLLIAWLGLRNIPDEFLQRKLLHLWTSVSTILLYFILPHVYLIALSLLFVLFFAFYPGRLVGNRLGLAGFPLSVAFATYFFHADAQTWMLSLSPMFFSDPLAALFGRYGSRSGFICGKTLLGGAVFFLSTAILALLLGVNVLGSVILSSILTLVEMASPLGIDNLSVPLSAATVVNGWLGFAPWIALPLSIFIALLIVRLGWLTLCGGLAVAALGTVILCCGGMEWVLPLIVFVGVASVVGRLLGSEERTRDVNQVFANAGVPALMVVLYTLTGDEIFYYMNLSAVAAMLGDTLATELGMRFSRRAYYIIGFRPVEKGTSGGVSGWGFVGALLGGFLIGMFAGERWMAVVISGFLGTVVDSLIGATLEGRGFWNNDTTNFVASLLASLIYLLITHLL